MASRYNRAAVLLTKKNLAHMKSCHMHVPSHLILPVAHGQAFIALSYGSAQLEQAGASELSHFDWGVISPPIVTPMSSVQPADRGGTGSDGLEKGGGSA